jgi:hypothetical protein
LHTKSVVLEKWNEEAGTEIPRHGGQKRRTGLKSRKNKGKRKKKIENRKGLQVAAIAGVTVCILRRIRMYLPVA